MLATVAVSLILLPMLTVSAIFFYIHIYIVFKILTGTPTGKKPLGRPRRRCININNEYQYEELD